MKETHIQKNRLQRIITELGGKPRIAKADLSKLAPPATIIMKKDLYRPPSQKMRITFETILCQKRELGRIKQDRIIKFNELEGYESLIKKCKRWICRGI